MCSCSSRRLLYRLSLQSCNAATESQVSQALLALIESQATLKRPLGVCRFVVRLWDCKGLRFNPMISDVPLCQDAQVPDVSCEQISCKKMTTLECDPTWLMLFQPFLPLENLQDSLGVAARLSESECNELLASKRRSYGMKRYDRTRWDPVGMTGWAGYPTSPKTWGGKRTQAGNTCGNNVQINLKQDIIIGSFYLAGSGRLSFWIFDLHVSEWISARKLTLGAHDAEMQKGSSLFQQIPASMWRYWWISPSSSTQSPIHSCARWFSTRQRRDNNMIRWSFKYANIYIYIYRVLY